MKYGCHSENQLRMTWYKTFWNSSTFQKQNIQTLNGKLLIKFIIVTLFKFESSADF